jgi:peroxiredoxin
MALTSSGTLPLGSAAPRFRLPDPSGRLVSLEDFAGAPALAVMFLCNHCPYVKHVADGVARFAREYAPRGLALVAINPNDAERYPDDAPPRMAEEAKRRGYEFPYLVDAEQAVAKAYRAACTPEFYLFDRGRKLFYHGQFDGSRPANALPVTGADLRAAADALLAGGPAPEPQRPSVGCSIKWKPGREPDYA